MSAASFASSAVLWLALAFCPACIRAQGTEVPRYDSTPEDVALAERLMDGLAAAAGTETSAGLLVRAAKGLLGQPYVAGTLEGGKERLRIYLTRTDCILFAETCLGLVRTVQRCGADARMDDLAVTLLQSRYRGGVADGYASRLHYTSEWILQGVENGLFQDVTKELGGVRDPRPVRYMSAHPDSYPPLKGESPEAKENLRRIRAAEERLDGVARHYLPKEKIAAAEESIRSGDILCFATSIDGLDYSHVVIAYREGPGGRLGFIHASSAAGKVIVEPRSLEEYLRANRRITGITVLRLK